MPPTTSISGTATTADPGSGLIFRHLAWRTVQKCRNVRPDPVVIWRRGLRGAAPTAGRARAVQDAAALGGVRQAGAAGAGRSDPGGSAGPGPGSPLALDDRRGRRAGRA